MSNGNLKFLALPTNGSKSAVLRAIRDSSPISRSVLASKTGMTVPAVSRTVSELIADNLVLDKPLADTAGPRRKRGLVLDPSAAHCIGLCIMPGHIEGCVVNSAYEVLDRRDVRFAYKAATKEQILDLLMSLAEELRAAVPAENRQCVGLVCVSPGLVDTTGRNCLGSSIMPSLVDLPLADILEERLGLASFITNGSQANLRAVERLDLDEPTESLMFVFYSEGIGASLKLHNSYICGTDNLAGEIGHMVVTEEPVPCGCGGVGCLEAVASKPALAAQAAEAVANGTASSLADIETITGDDVLQAAAAGDRLAVRLTRQAYGYIAKAIAGLVLCVAPQRIIFSNSFKLAGDELFDWLCHELRQHLLPQYRENITIQLSETHSYLTSTGAAFMGMDKALEY